MADLQPAVVTFRPDNLLTVGLLGVGAYLGAVLVAQLAMRAGLIKPQAPAAASTTSGGQPPTAIV